MRAAGILPARRKGVIKLGPDGQMDIMAGRLHGGDIYQGGIRYDFSVNVNPLGLPSKVKEVLRASVDHWDRYPDPECRELTERLAEYHKAEKGRIVCGNGAADLIYRLVCRIKPCQALLPSPTFSEYEQALRQAGCRNRFFCLKEEQDFSIDVERMAGMLEEGEAVFLCNPNNPTGLALDAGQVKIMADACKRKHGLLILDECFCEFLDKPGDYSFMERIKEYPEAVILRAFTKSYAMAGLRLGYAVCGDIGLAGRLRLTGQPWGVSIPAQEAGAAALGESGYLEQARILVRKEREWMGKRLAGLGFKVFPSQANYLLFKDEEEHRHGYLWDGLRKKGILIRDCGNFNGLERKEGGDGVRYYRVGIRSHEENERLLEAVSDLAKAGG